MRITENMRFLSVQRSLGQLRSQQADLTDQLSSGTRVGAPSDDPVAAANLTRLSGQAARTADYRSTIATVRSDASTSEATLAQASDLMVRAHELAVEGGNGSLSGPDRKALAVEVSALRDQLIATANTRGSQGYLFSGSQTTTPTLSPTGQYQGDAAEHQVEVSPGVKATVNVTGSDAFTDANGGTDAFATLSALQTALENNDQAGITATLDPLEASRAQMTRVRSKAGLILNRLDAADGALATTALELEKRKSSLADVDPVAALSKLTQLSTALDQSISVARNVLGSGQNQF
jgi:flagellar hook-associated protein 3 FlgL